ncbi:MAG: hypothetical protein COA42_15015 [Alteromonadaceae bacterium]|nr:MAG: hypothetical protein COA42_15015 [Alteromonadaceae bacterium]
MNITTKKPKIWGVLLLFSSIPTLLCCAIPILFVSLGMGSVVASLYGEYFPFLRWFGLHENWTFGITAFILICAGGVLFRCNKVCPSDSGLAQACASVQCWNVRFFWAAVVLWCIGAYTAFMLPII